MMIAWWIIALPLVLLFAVGAAFAIVKGWAGTIVLVLLAIASIASAVVGFDRIDSAGGWRSDIVGLVLIGMGLGFLFAAAVVLARKKKA